jgi:hypothetical protein
VSYNRSATELTQASSHSLNLLAYFWGKITKKWQAPRVDGFHYSIQFHDGDLLSDIISEHFHRLQEAVHLQLDFFVPPPPEYLRDQNITTTAQELFEMRCRKCAQCQTRTECGKCFACVQNNRGEKNQQTTKQCCVRKICSVVEMSQRARPCEFLPDGWLYFFDDEQENPEFKGLFLISKVNLTKERPYKFKSFGSVATRSPRVFSDYEENQFYEHVGLFSRGGGSGSDEASAPSRSITLPRSMTTRGTSSPPRWSSGTWSLKELLERCCGDCANCNRGHCRDCDSCKRAIGECCLRRVSSVLIRRFVFLEYLMVSLTSFLSFVPHNLDVLQNG